MATDISLVGNVVEITEGSAQPVGFANAPAKYRFNKAGDTLSLTINNEDYSIPFADLTIETVAPANVAAAYTALSTVFPSAGASAIPTLAQVLEAGNSAGNFSINMNENDISNSLNITAVNITATSSLSGSSVEKNGDAVATEAWVETNYQPI